MDAFVIKRVLPDSATCTSHFQDFLSKTPKSIGHEPAELSACRWREQQEERRKEAETLF